MSDIERITKDNTPEEEQIPFFIMPLVSRSVISMSGSDARKFLQNILTNDINLVDEHNTIFAALLTPQGKFLYDAFICLYGDDILLLDCNRDNAEGFIAQLESLKMHMDVRIEDETENLFVAAVYGEGMAEAIADEGKGGNVYDFGSGIIYIDPRTPLMHARMICRRTEDAIPNIDNLEFELASEDFYHYYRIISGVPESGADLVSGKSNPMDFQYDLMNAFDFDKGCYIGQEVISRIVNQGKRKYAILPVSYSGVAPEVGADITMDKKSVGTYLSSAEDVGLAKIRIEHIEDIKSSKSRLVAGGKTFIELFDEIVHVDDGEEADDTAQ